MVDQALQSFSFWRIKLFCTTMSLNISFSNRQAWYALRVDLFNINGALSEDFSLMMLTSTLLILAKRFYRDCLPSERDFGF